MMTVYLRREIHEFMYVGIGGMSPIKYLPVSSAAEQSLLVALYEPSTITVYQSIIHLQHVH